MNRIQTDKENRRGFPKLAGIFLGLGLGGFFDGIILHQVLQWHHMCTSAGYPANNLDNLEFNTMWDGFFHLSTYIFTALGLTLLWRAARQPHVPWSAKMLPGAMLIGFGIFNLVEGIIDHQLLGIHHVNEMVPPEQWIFWFGAHSCSLADGYCCELESLKLPKPHLQTCSLICVKS